MPVQAILPSKVSSGYFRDWTTPTLLDNGKAVVWNNTSKKHEYLTFPTGGVTVHAELTGLDANDHPQYLLVENYNPGGSPGGNTTEVQFNSSGVFAGESTFTYDAANNRLTVTGGLIAPSMRPASDSTTALQWQNAAGSAYVIGDSANGRIAIGFSTSVDSGYGLAVRGAAGIDGGVKILSNNQTQFLGLNWGGMTSSSNLTFGAGGFVRFQPGSGGYLGFTDSGGGNFVMYVPANSRLMAFGGHTDPTTVIDLIASTIVRASLRIRSGIWPTTPNDGDVANDGNCLITRVNGTNAVNIDGGLSIVMQSSTTARNVGRLLWQYTDKTDATRKTKGSLTAFNTSTEYKPITWGADSSGELLSFYNITTPIARQLLTLSATNAEIATALANLGLTRLS